MKNLIRSLEQRLEAILDGVASRMFHGPLHPTELAGRIIRRADLSVTDTERGPVAANRFVVSASPDDVDEAADLSRVEEELARLVEEAAAERGWRLEGPTRVELTTDPRIRTGEVKVEARIEKGPRDPWCWLVGDHRVPVCVNRAVIGRAADVDVVISDPHVSRRHATIWREAGRVMVADLGSANGTTADGTRVSDEGSEVRPGSVIRFGPVAYRLEM
jgi:hypothetical protein